MIDFDASPFGAAMTAAQKTIMESVGESTLRTVGFAGAEIFRDESQRNLLPHSKSFTIYNNVIVKRLPEESDGGRNQVYLVTVRSGPRDGDDAFYWRWFANGHAKVRENKNVSSKTGRKIGWKAHRKREAKYWQKKAQEKEFGTARVKANPFMRPAFESKKAEAVDVMTRTLAEQIARNIK